MKTKVYAVDEKHPAYWPTGPLIRFLRPEKAVRCVACGKKSKKHWTMLCPFRAVIFGECTFEIKAERFPVQMPGTAVCDDHPLHPELPDALIGCVEWEMPEPEEEGD